MIEILEHNPKSYHERHAKAIGLKYEPELPFNQPDAQDTHRQKFFAYHRKYPEVYQAIEAEALARSGRLSMKGIYEALRGKFPHLNNSYTGDYTDILCADHPSLAHRFERRRRPERKMKLVYTR